MAVTCAYNVLTITMASFGTWMIGADMAIDVIFRAKAKKVAAQNNTPSMIDVLAGVNVDSRSLVIDDQVEDHR